MIPKNSISLHIEQLENRVLPAIWNFTSIGGTLTVEQIAAATGTVDIVDDGTTVTLSDGATTVSVSSEGVSNTNYKLFPNDTGDVNFSQTGFRPGNVTFNINNRFARNFDFDDGTGGIGGNFVLLGGSGDTTLNSDIGTSEPVTIFGSATFDLGSGFDNIELGEGGDLLTVGGNITLIDVNDIDFDEATVGGSVFVRNNRENMDNFLETDDGGNFTLIGGNLYYLGGSGEDNFQLEGTIAVNVFLNLGSQPTTGTSHIDVATNANGAVLAGNVTVIGGNLGTEIFSTDLGTTIGGNLYLRLGGGINDVDILSFLGGQYFTYQGGVGTDSVMFNPDVGSSRMRLSIQTQLGDDLVELDTTNAAPVFAFIDFGAGSDMFLFTGFNTFPLILRNLP